MTGFDRLPSRTPFSPARTSERLDPYYDALWSDGTQAAWLSKARATRSVRAGIGKLPHHLNGDPRTAWARLEAGTSWEARLDTLGTVDAWRTVTAEQLAAFTGHDLLASGKSRVTGDLFAADLLEVGVFSDAMRKGPREAAGTLFRPARTSSATDRLEQMLTYPEWVSVTSGTGFEFTRQFDRHNLLATELGLRVAEFCPVGTVLGEKLSVVNTLAYDGWGLDPAHPASQQTADLTIVREDGLRIAVEITASQGKALEAKIHKWASVLARRRLSESGLVVLFVVAGRADSSQHTTGQVMKKTREAITRAARIHPGVAGDRTVERMFLAKWSDWFPERGAADASFLTLAAQRPVGDPVNPWELAELLVPADVRYQPVGGVDPRAVIVNSVGLRSVPYWLRDGNPPQLWPRTLARQGFDTIPHLTGLTDKGRVRQEFNTAAGAAGAAGPVERLLFRGR